MAPANGMVIYKRESDGQKRTAGATINPRDLTMATLPDLSKMVSKTYVNEIDIGKVKIGQMVGVEFGAFPEIQMEGIVVSMANVGEAIPNSDAKVFEVKIELTEMINVLKPSMTTTNNVIIDVVDDVLFVPIDATFQNDSLTFVYTKKGYRQIVTLGEKNENHVIVERGLDEGEILYLSIPPEPETFDFKN